MSKSFSALLDACRWIAAFLVVIAHARQFIFVRYENVVDKNIFVKGFYFITGFGHEAVMVFFVISGFLVGGLTLRKWSTQIGYRYYFAARVSRIYTVLIPALFLGGILDWFGSHYLNSSEIYTNSSNFPANSVIVNNLNLTTLLGNLFNLQGIVVPSYGSNIPLWSLANEWWYYIIFAAGLIFWFGSVTFLRLTALLFGSVLLVLLPSKLIIWMFIWLLGVGLYLYAESSLPKPKRLIGIIFFVIALVVSRLSHSVESAQIAELSLKEFSRDYGFSLAFSLFLLSCYKCNFAFPMENISKLLANFSYSMYAFHFPIIVFLVALLHDTYGVKYLRHPEFTGIVYFELVVLVVYVIGYLLSRVTEKYTPVIRTIISSKPVT